MSVSEELLDVVDADDRVVGTASRSEIHTRGLMHRAVHVLVFNRAGDLFLQKRSLAKDENPGLWDSSAAGHVDSGEDYLDCARREIGEELGIETRVEFVVLFKLNASAITGFEHCTVYRIDYDGPLRLDPDEIDDGAWTDAAAMDARVAADDPQLTDSLRLIWRTYRNLPR